MPTMPQPESEEEFDALDRASPVFVQAVAAMFNQYAGGLAITPTVAGSYPVFYVGKNHVAKLFAPIHRCAFETERAVLRQLEQDPGGIAPKLVECGESGGWTAILMTRLKGESVKASWSRMDSGEQCRFCESLGAVVRTMHNTAWVTQDAEQLKLRPDSKGDPSCDVVASGWDGFVAQQTSGCTARQVARGLEPKLAEQIPEFLSSVELGVRNEVLVHTEIMLEHVFVEATNDAQRITGLIDFEPAFVGEAEYEFASVGLFIAGGHPELLASFMRGYGEVADAEYHRRIMAYALLHRYSRLSWYLQFMPPRDSLESLAESWFSHEPATVVVGV